MYVSAFGGFTCLGMCVPIYVEGVHIFVHVCADVYVGQRITLDVIPQLPSIFKKMCLFLCYM